MMRDVRETNSTSKSWKLGIAAAICAAAFVGYGVTAVAAQNAGGAAPQAGAAAAPDAAGGAQGAAPGRGRGGAGRGIQADPDHPVMPIGTAAPEFSLPGVEGKNHTLGEFSKAKVLAVVFESNHCPVSIAYEERIRKIYEDYKDKGVQLIAINPNNASAVRLNELGYTDSTDSLPEMETRAKLRNIDWPYLYDGETQTTAGKFGAVATPHIFIFDQDRKLRYEGRIDDATDIHKVTISDARNAIDALLAGQPVQVSSTHAFGCTTKWLSKSTGVKEEMEAIVKEPVTITNASVDDLKKIRENAGTGKTMVVAFWSTKCPECEAEFLGYENTFRMYRRRKFDMVMVNTDKPADQAQALAYLQDQHASGTNLQVDPKDAKALEAAMGAQWKMGSPFVMVIGPDGSVVYQNSGTTNILEVRRHVLASIPNDGPWFGVQEYWTGVIAAEKTAR
jgi:peroxiredoxin